MIDYRGPDIAAIRPSDLARRLGFVAVWRGRPINLVGGKPLGGTASNGVTPVLTHLGPAYSLSGSGTGGISMSPVPDSAAFTMLVMARSITSGSSALGRVMSTFNGTAGNDWYYDGGSHNIQVFTASTNSTFTLPSSLLTGSTFQCVAISLSGVVGAQTPIAYADGVPVTVSTVAAGSGARVAGGTTLGVGYRPDTTGRQAGGVFVLAAYATRHLSARELAQVTARPNLLLAPRRIWVPVSAGSATPITTATETDTSQAIASSQRASVGLATETDSAIAIASSQRATLGLASETDSAQALAAHQAQTIGLASETDAAQPISIGAVVSVGLASETDTAQALASNQAASVGLVSETDTAQSISVTGAGTLGTASETDTAQALVANQSATVGLASETDTAQPISRVEFITVGLASETDTAQPIVSLQRASISPALETDTAQEIGITGGEPPAPPAPTFQPGYKHNPRTARDLDPLPPTGDDLADLVRDKWDAIERANAAIKRARGGDAPAQATVSTPAPAPAPRPSKRPAGAIAAAGLPLTEEQLRADEEAFILMVAEIL